MQTEPTLFDIDIPLANKIDSYYSEQVQTMRTTQKERVLAAIEFLGSASDREISEHTGIERHLIPDRRKALKHKIKISHSALDEKTGKTVTFYKINDEPSFA